MIQISEGNNRSKNSKKKKKSFWFEYAEKKGVDPHKSAWTKFKEENSQKQKNNIHYCTKCGTTLKPDTKFCERCGQRVRTKQ
ncbi:MAG: zinc-ribbon domain-containing protein [Candidatus Hodarchaeales archaeon]